MTVSTLEKVQAMYRKDFRRAARRAFGRQDCQMLLAHLAREEYGIINDLVQKEHRESGARRYTNTDDHSNAWWPRRATLLHNRRIQERFSRANELLSTWTQLVIALNLNNLP